MTVYNSERMEMSSYGIGIQQLKHDKKQTAGCAVTQENMSLGRFWFNANTLNITVTPNRLSPDIITVLHRTRALERAGG